MIRKSVLGLFLLLLILVGCVNRPKPKITITNGQEVDIAVGDTYQLMCQISNLSGKASWEASNSNVSISNLGLITGLAEGEATITVSLQDKTASVQVKVLAELAPLTEDPYLNVTKEEFYSNYMEATSFMDAYYRTQHYFLAGSNVVPDQAPTLASYQPQENGKYVRNTSAYYADNGNTYYIIDSYGNVVDAIYRGAAYITLEEVAAYLLAFGDVPANYVMGKTLSPTNSLWGEYLRLNHSYFSGDTATFPYEPLLPDISGEGGNLDYYEIDLGTTGTDCDPNYLSKIYNDGLSITRGAARLVYTRYDEDGNNLVDVNDKYVFYTYNHYNDFQEYLNYYGGWGEMFGNITGGGEISSRENYNPTPYVEVARAAFININ